jgi:AcrR family transcriptional regulator
MPDNPGGVTAKERRIGRPPRIDTDVIADAVLEVGVDDATVRNVAALLGVSVPGLYHHVNGRQDLLRIAAERTVAGIRMPNDRRMHWAQWLRMWGRFVRREVVSQPEMAALFASGRVMDDGLVEIRKQAITVLGRVGFDPPDAVDVFESVSVIALGTAMQENRVRAHAKRRPERPSREPSNARAKGRMNLQLLDGIGDNAPSDPDERFESRLTDLLVGVAHRRGLALDDVLLDIPRRDSGR